MSEKELDKFPLNFWYAALPSEKLKRGNMLRQKLLDRPFLLLRDNNGKASALADYCPHRGIPLSDGTFDGNNIECCYHGWKFDCTGKCTDIPSLVPGSPVKPEKIHTKKFPCEERDGLIWIYISDSKKGEIKEVPTLQTFSEKI